MNTIHESGYRAAKNGELPSQCPYTPSDGKAFTVWHEGFASAKWMQKNMIEVPRLHPESYQQLRQLVKLHGMTAVVNALQEITREE